MEEDLITITPEMGKVLEKIRAALEDEGGCLQDCADAILDLSDEATASRFEFDTEDILVTIKNVREGLNKISMDFQKAIDKIEGKKKGKSYKVDWERVKEALEADETILVSVMTKNLDDPWVMKFLTQVVETGEGEYCFYASKYPKIFDKESSPHSCCKLFKEEDKKRFSIEMEE